MDDGKCPFVGAGCDGGTVSADGWVGCAYKAHAGDVCEWTAELPAGTSPRDFYNAMAMEAAR